MSDLWRIFDGAALVCGLAFVVVLLLGELAGELPTRLLFLPYGDMSSRLMGGDTHGTGMPNSKSFDVELEKASCN